MRSVSKYLIMCATCLSRGRCIPSYAQNQTTHSGRCGPLLSPHFTIRQDHSVDNPSKTKVGCISTMNKTTDVSDRTGLRIFPGRSINMPMVHHRRYMHFKSTQRALRNNTNRNHTTMTTLIPSVHYNSGCHHVFRFARVLIQAKRVI